MTTAAADARWPDLPLEQWRDTLTTLHLWTQIVGKVRLAQTPWLNHSWHVTLYVSPRGLTTGTIPHSDQTFSLEFDFIDHQLRLSTSRGLQWAMPLEPRSVADFHAALMTGLEAHGVPVRIHGRPNEIADAIAFSDDHSHASYDRDSVHRAWHILRECDRVLTIFRTRFLGKSSPVHFFWGSFDMAVTRFSGRAAPQHPGGVPNLPDVVTREAYSHEVSSAGFWFGGGPVAYPAFYSYAYPEPPGFRTAPVRPDAAFFSTDAQEFILPYTAVRTAADPDAVLLEFLQSTYEAAASSGNWDRSVLECAQGRPGVPRHAT